VDTSAAQTLTITVTNVAPTASLTTLAGSVTDPAALDHHAVAAAPAAPLSGGTNGGRIEAPVDFQVASSRNTGADQSRNGSGAVSTPAPSESVALTQSVKPEDPLTGKNKGKR